MGKLDLGNHLSYLRIVRVHVELGTSDGTLKYRHTESQPVVFQLRMLTEDLRIDIDPVLRPRQPVCGRAKPDALIIDGDPRSFLLRLDREKLAYLFFNEIEPDHGLGKRKGEILNRRFSASMRRQNAADRHGGDLHAPIFFL